jgi:hypothetical protein
MHITHDLAKYFPHQFELAIRWYKANGSVAIEFTKLDALMELAIVNFNSIGSAQWTDKAMSCKNSRQYRWPFPLTLTL